MSTQSVHDWLLHDSIDPLAKRPAHAGAGDHRQNGIDQPLAQFLEVIEKAHGGHRFRSRFAAGGCGSEVKHATPARLKTLLHGKELVRSRSTARLNRSHLLRQKVVRPAPRPATPLSP